MKSVNKLNTLLSTMGLASFRAFLESIESAEIAGLTVVRSCKIDAETGEKTWGACHTLFISPKRGKVKSFKALADALDAGDGLSTDEKKIISSLWSVSADLATDAVTVGCVRVSLGSKLIPSASFHVKGLAIEAEDSEL